MTGPAASPARMTRWRRTLLAWGIPVLAFALAAAFGWSRWGTAERAVLQLDPAQVRVVRTPGGMLEVATLQKAEHFGWQVSHTCPLVDCGELFGKTTSEIKVTVHFTYRIALEPQWTLRFDRDHYELRVPPLEAKTPVAFDTASIQIRTEKGGWLSPAAGPNREAVVRHLGGELARRAEQPAYKRLVEQSAAATVAEFANRWMAEQAGPARYPVRVSFTRRPARLPSP